jgi:hypothetical protein
MQTAVAIFATAIFYTYSTSGTPQKIQTTLGTEEEPGLLDENETRMDVEASLTPGTMARANKMLDEDDTPAKENNTSAGSRKNSLGITALTSKLENLAKKTGSVGDDDVFKKNASTVIGTGVPDASKKNPEVRIHSETAQVGAPNKSTGTGKNESSGSGSSSTSRVKSFPSAYYNVRKLRANAQPTAELCSITGDRRGSAVVNHNKLTPGFELKDDERPHTVKNFHIPAMKRNVSTNIIRDGNEIRCVTCKNTHVFTGSEPVCVILTDQNFPPALPTDKMELCCIVIRLEDCFLSELPGLLKEFFGNRTGYLPEGSLLLFGSQSHLGKRGLENYAEECVKLQKVFTNMLPRTCSITHLLVVPLGGIESAGLIRDLYDLDCWLRVNTGTNVPSLPAARTKLWEILNSSNTGTGTHSDRTLFLPESLTSSNKIRTISGRPPVVPEKIEPISEKDEVSIVETLCREINENYALNIDENPVLIRCSETETESKIGTGRIFAIGGSHIARLAGGLACHDCEIINLSKPGWIADPVSIADCAAKLKTYNLSDADTVICDLLSNSIFCGTDSKGNPSDPEKINGVWHIVGELTIRPKTVLKTVLQNCNDIFGQVSPRVICLVPVARYISAKCCNDRDHVKNYTEADYANDIEAGLELAEDLLTGWAQNIASRADIINFRSVADDPEQLLQDLRFEDDPFWAEEDPVHCVAKVYSAMAGSLISLLNSGEDEGDGEPAAKRQRLESVVVQRSGSATNAAPRRSTASWSTGLLPPSRGRGGRARGGPYRGHPFGGRQRGWFRPYGRGRGRF